jgi:hypothetical protein
MRKTLVTMVVIGLVAGSFAAPATAQKRKQKKVEESFTAQALPFPNLSSATETEDRGCLAGIEGVNKVSHAFTTPGAGTLTAHMAGFITDAEGKEIDGSVNDQALDMAPAEEKVTVKLKKGQDVHIVPCNWLGAPQAEIHIEYVYR